MKILHLEDSLNDAELTHFGLREEWPDCEIQTVSTRDEFQAALAAGSPDVILSDFNMPAYNGLDALRLARAVVPDVPFIFLSGTIGEERALEALRSGASDYVIKDRPKRLIPALQRALHDVQLARERRATEEQMQRVQRLENLGMLAAGIAHDFNNVLAPLLMGIPLLRMSHPDPRDEKILASMEKSAERGVGLVKQILGFAHGVTGAPQLIQPGHLIDEIVGMMRQTFPKTIAIEVEIKARLWPIKANPPQFHQVLLNLCVNARDAMPQGGTLTVRAANRTLDEMGAAAIPNARPGKYLALEIADTGTGIPPDVVARIWDPFFTTKGAGKGTGLGLSTVRGIVTQHEGVITLQSQPGRGTTFSVLLPAAPGNEAGSDPGGLLAVPRGQGELILVVDDDASIREVTAATLTGHGYRVLAAADGTEAVALFAPRCLEIRAVIADRNTPQLDGLALFKIVRALNPAVRVILVSGSAEPGQPRTDKAAAVCLSKPYSGETLLRAVHELFQESTAFKGGPA